MPTLHLMIGLPCSGKTTHAKQLAKDTGALMLSLDRWHIALFGDDVGDPMHDERHMRIEGIMWDIAAHTLRIGGDVILDYGCWARSERDDYRAKAHALGASFRIHYMDVSIDELYQRLKQRNLNPTEGVFVIPESEMDKYLPRFEPPTADELI